MLSPCSLSEADLPPLTLPVPDPAHYLAGSTQSLLLDWWSFALMMLCPLPFLNTHSDAVPGHTSHMYQLRLPIEATVYPPFPFQE